MSLVAIVGRPNVGKSTLFNRLVGMRQAIVDETAGVTRDRHYGKCEWEGKEFSVVDTGGWTSNSDDVFEEAIRKQVEIAIEEADLILFMVEAATGITDYDAEIADLLRRSGKPVVLCVNKVDSGDKMYDTYQFYSLGLGEVWSISAANGSGTGDLLDEIIRVLPEDTVAEDDHPELPHIAIVGKPNVGKSSLVNALGNNGKLARVSQTPGKTQQIIYFDMDGQAILADLPGYGYSKASKDRSRGFSELCDNYFRVRKGIDLVLLLIDIRHEPSNDDIGMLNFLNSFNKLDNIILNL